MEKSGLIFQYQQQSIIIKVNDTNWTFLMREKVNKIQGVSLMHDSGYGKVVQATRSLGT